MRSAIKESQNATAQYAVSNEATQLHPTSSSSRGASAKVITQDTREGTQGGRKRPKQRFQEAAIASDDDGGDDKRADGSGVAHVVAVAGSGKR
jgi:hypothetical protein